MASASSLFRTVSFLPSAPADSRAVKAAPLPRGLRLASMFQYSSGLNCSISSSRSRMMRTATLCTRPADRPLRTLCHKKGLSL